MRYVKQLDGVSGKFVVVDTNPSPDRVVAVCDTEDNANLIVDALNAYV